MHLVEIVHAFHIELRWIKACLCWISRFDILFWICVETCWDLCSHYTIQRLFFGRWTAFGDFFETAGMFWFQEGTLWPFRFTMRHHDNHHGVPGASSSSMSVFSNDLEVHPSRKKTPSCCEKTAVLRKMNLAPKALQGARSLTRYHLKATWEKEKTQAALIYV